MNDIKESESSDDRYASDDSGDFGEKKKAGKLETRKRNLSDAAVSSVDQPSKSKKKDSQ